MNARIVSIDADYPIAISGGQQGKLIVCLMDNGI
jgi:hypothetical protein